MSWLKLFYVSFLTKPHMDMLDIGPNLYALCMCVSWVVDVTSTAIVRRRDHCLKYER